MSKFGLIFILTIVSFISCKKEPNPSNRTNEIEKVNVEIDTITESERVDRVFEEFKKLYNELGDFKKTSNFKKYGFAEGGKNKIWLDKLRVLKSNPDSKLLIKKGILISELEQLGLAYASSKGVETEVTETFNKIFTEAILPKIKTEKTQIIENSNSWYEGGNLHKKDGTEWKRATEHNKLATCADFTMTIALRNGEEPSVFSSKFKKASESLKDCIDKFYKLPESEKITVPQAVINCISN